MDFPVFSLRAPAKTARIVILSMLCGMMSGFGRSPLPIVVGSKNSTEQMILGEIVAQQLERRLGRKVERRFNLGNTLITYQSLQSDQISLYPEYTGMIVTEILKEPPATDASLVFERAKGEMRRIAQSELLDPLGLSNTFTAIISSSDP